MDISTTMPPTLYIAIGAILAAVIAGFFSFANLVSSKENKISEFRLSWIDGLRNEIAEYSAALQELIRVENLREYYNESQKTQVELEQQWFENSKEAFQQAIKTLSCIQMRLNPESVKNDPESYEAILMRHITNARNEFNKENYENASKCCIDIRDTASHLLKSTWDTVKIGEPEYRNIRKKAWIAIKYGVTLSAVSSIVLIGLAAAH
ncbi:hypothetical protein J1G35_10825 [Pseudomonas sp. SH10-3B]|uniref:hypothetical protein n=1 Tax=Pseudomonas sp. SH10-3B TaxID=2816049 RepID=UPI001CA7940B|nr:hypothetical protein [Pseudomonas sp. SH10-3B]MBY8946360.1 hypothetical protein [Pseudomonas sp. SH10-3B]